MRYEVVDVKHVEPCGLPMFDRFPVEPVVIQVWHAFGAFKKFGYQSLDTPEGHSAEIARLFRIHRNNSWVLCSGEKARSAFAEAFNMPMERVIALPRPEFFKLQGIVSSRKPCSSLSQKIRVQFAPTLRKRSDTVHPLRDLYASDEWYPLRDFANIIWSFHPLEETGFAASDVSEALIESDYVITDYSSIVYEAHLLDKRVLFYVPDLDEYRKSPGLNADPGIICPDLCFASAKEMIVALEAFATGKRDYPKHQFRMFAQCAFDETNYSPDCIVDFALTHVRDASL